MAAMAAPGLPWEQRARVPCRTHHSLRAAKKPRGAALWKRHEKECPSTHLTTRRTHLRDRSSDSRKIPPSCDLALGRGLSACENATRSAGGSPVTRIRVRELGNVSRADQCHLLRAGPVATSTKRRAPPSASSDSNRATTASSWLKFIHHGSRLTAVGNATRVTLRLRNNSRRRLTSPERRLFSLHAAERPEQAPIVRAPRRHRRSLFSSSPERRHLRGRARRGPPERHDFAAHRHEMAAAGNSRT
jgi:hypothetical protein